MDEEDDDACPMCDEANPPMGMLGKRLWYRCRACGMQWSRERPPPTPSPIVHSAAPIPWADIPVGHEGIVASMSEKIVEFIGGLTAEESLELAKLALQNVPNEAAVNVVVDWAEDADLLSELAEAAQTASDEIDEAEVDDAEEEVDEGEDEAK
jgi:rubredoxin